MNLASILNQDYTEVQENCLESFSTQIQDLCNSLNLNFTEWDDFKVNEPDSGILSFKLGNKESFRSKISKFTDKRPESCFSFKLAENEVNQKVNRIFGNDRISRRDSIRSDWEKNRAEFKKIACFAQPAKSFTDKLIGDFPALERTPSLPVLRTFKPLNNLSEVSNQSTCSLKTSNNSKNSDDPYFYEGSHVVRNDVETPRMGKASTCTNTPNNRESIESVHSKPGKDSQSSLFGLMKRWIPDEYSKRWMKCKRMFDFFTRKHHCRRWGYLLCFSCCGQWVKIKEIVRFEAKQNNHSPNSTELKKVENFSKKNTMVRVCDGCVDEIRHH